MTYIYEGKYNWEYVIFLMYLMYLTTGFSRHISSSYPPWCVQIVPWLFHQWDHSRSYSPVLVLLCISRYFKAYTCTKTCDTRLEIFYILQIETRYLECNTFLLLYFYILRKQNCEYESIDSFFNTAMPEIISNDFI